MISFRALQGVSSTAFLGYWLTRIAMDSHHLHPTWLLAAIGVLVASEAGYRFGKSEQPARISDRR